MTPISLLALTGALILLVITPGPGVFATVARSLASGFSHAAVLVAGLVMGDLVFLLFAIYGLVAVAELLGGLFVLVKYLGGAYLIWLGLKLWRSRPAEVRVEGVGELSWRANFLSGLFITLGNPKVILFYLGFLPTFVNLNTLTGADILVLVVLTSVVIGASLLGYAYLAARARRLFQTRRAQRIVNRTAGGVMIATGTVLVAKG